MSRTYHHGERRIILRGIRRERPDLRRVARAIVELAQMRAEAEAEAEHGRKAERRRQHQSQESRPEPDREGSA